MAENISLALCPTDSKNLRSLTWFPWLENIKKSGVKSNDSENIFFKFYLVSNLFQDFITHQANALIANGICQIFQYEELEKYRILLIIPKSYNNFLYLDFQTFNFSL